MKKFVSIFALVSVFCATAAFAAPQEAHSWDELQRLCRVQLAQRDNQGNSTSDGGRLGYLRWDVEWKVTDDWRVYSGSTSERKSGEVLPAGSEFYAWFLGGNSTPSPTPAPAPAPVSNDQPAAPGDLVSFANLSQYGKVEQRDSLWMVFVPFQDCRLDLAIFACFDQNDFSNEVVGTEGQAAIGSLRQGGHYLLVARELFRDFVPESDDDLKLLAHPKIGVETGPVWTPEGRTIRNYYVVLASEWEVKDNTAVLYESNVNRAKGEVIPAGGKILVNVTPIKDDGDGVSRSDGEGGGGGCDAAGLGLLALGLLAIFLKRKRR